MGSRRRRHRRKYRRVTAAADDLHEFGLLVGWSALLVVALALLLLVVSRRLTRVEAKVGNSAVRIEAVHEQLTEPNRGSTTVGKIDAITRDMRAGFLEFDRRLIAVEAAVCADTYCRKDTHATR